MENKYFLEKKHYSTHTEWKRRHSDDSPAQRLQVAEHSRGGTAYVDFGRDSSCMRIFNVVAYLETLRFRQ